MWGRRAGPGPKERNRFRKLVIHTVVDSENQWFRQQLPRIAEAPASRLQWARRP